ncbi:unnamed protein product, partial [Vitis vinifera]|uniref:Secreted protein n=1 Tax=Vitis vinifera TaxID=29760 RepID=D7TUD9_VITVI
MPACSSCYPILVSIICVITLLIDHHSRAHFQHPIPSLPCIHPRPSNSSQAHHHSCHHAPTITPHACHTHSFCIAYPPTHFSHCFTMCRQLIISYTTHTPVH